ncbi:MAG: sulfatase-like hydrolase/transferase [Flavobacteriaceae bacterium]
MQDSYRLREHAVTIYRLALAFLFYFIARILFFLFNKDLFEIEGITELLSMCIWGLSFDSAAILYVNLLFILLSFLPLVINTTKPFQRVLIWLYFSTNLIAYATNFVDFIYYKYTFTRSTMAALESIRQEPNKGGLIFSFITDYWHVFLLFFICAYIWVRLYKKINTTQVSYAGKLKYFGSSTLAFFLVVILTIGGIRGDFKHSTRPINLVDASRHVRSPEHANIVLNTPFAIIRTFNATDFKKRKGVSQDLINTTFQPIKQYDNEVSEKPNIVLIIVESFGREYAGSFNKEMNIENYKSYTPFIDSLAKHSLIFPNAYANGRKSIHAMSSILAGIPSFKTAYTSSPYANKKIASIVSALNEMNYDTSFFHGAPNGSMGFLGFGNVLGYDHYYGMTEYNNDADYDGIWGIWDEPFLDFTANILSEKKQPFMSTIFTVSSHTPYIIPEKYEGKFPKGDIDMHQCIGYTDFSLKKFFDKVSKEPWYQNSVFVITGDHSNQIHYNEYSKIVNRFGLPLLIFDPSGKYSGVDNSLAQQIDIYPTLMTIAGYKKPFRSWGNSLVGDTIRSPFVITHTGTNLLFLKDSLIYMGNEDKALGLYHMADKGLTHNLMSEKERETEQMKAMANGFMQDYMNRIIEGRLDVQ